MYGPFLDMLTVAVLDNVHVRTIIILVIRFDRCKFDALCNLVKFFFFFFQNAFTSGKEESQTTSIVPQN